MAKHANTMRPKTSEPSEAGAAGRTSPERSPAQPDRATGGGNSTVAEVNGKASPPDQHLDITPEEAARAVANTAPSVFALGQHLAALERAHEAYDPVNLQRAASAVDETQQRAARAIQEDRMEALREMIASMPALTLKDAAVQVEAITVAASLLSCSTHTEAQVEAIADRIERMALSILPLIAAAADLDLEAMFWTDNLTLRAHRFAGVEAAQ